MKRARLMITHDFLDAVSQSVRNIVLDSFPVLTSQEKEDLEQDVRFKVLRLAKSGKKIRNWRSYLWKMIYRAALDIIDDRMKGFSLEELMDKSDAALRNYVDRTSPELINEKNESLAILREALDQLAERRRIVVKLHMTGMDLKEIANYLIMRENQVRHLLYRGIEDLTLLVRERVRTRQATPDARPIEAATRKRAKEIQDGMPEQA